MARSKKDSKDTLVSYWEDEIKAGEKYMEKYSSQSKWKEFRAMYRGDWVDNITPVNRMFSFGRSLSPRVYLRNPRVIITPTRPEFVAQARVIESVDNWLIKEMKLKKTIRTAILHAYLSGTAPVKLGYDSAYGFIPSQSVDSDTSTATQIGRKAGEAIEYNVNVKPGMPWALPAMPEDVIIPWGYKDPDDLPWIAHRIIRPLKDVQEDQKYQNTNKLTGTRRADFAARNQARNIYLQEDDLHYVELFEIRSAKTKEIIVLSEGQILMKQSDALQIEGFNYEFLTFNEDPEYFFGISDASILAPSQRELNEVKTQTSRHRKIALIKFLYQKNAISEIELSKFLSDEVGPAVGIDAESVASAIQILQPHIPPDLQGAAHEVLSDMRESMGFSENQVGAYRPGTPGSASESMTVEQSFEVRIDERKDMVSDFVNNIIRKVNQYVFSFWDTQRVTRVTGPQGESFWVKYTGEELRAEYDMLVDIESGFPISHKLKQDFTSNFFDRYKGDPMINQQNLRQMDLAQYEWLMPGVSGLLVPMPETDGAALGLLEKGMIPPPGPGAGNPPGTNQGGGRQGSSAENPLEFEQFKKQFQLNRRKA